MSEGTGANLFLKGPTVKIQEDQLLPYEDCLQFLSNILEELTSRFTKKNIYLQLKMYY